MATQSVADLSVDIKVQGLAGVKGDLDKLQSSFKRASSEAERVQRSLTSGMQQARTGVSQLSTSAAQAQRSIANMGTAFRAANDNVGRLTPTVDRLGSEIDATNAAIQRETAQLRRVASEANRTQRAKQAVATATRQVRISADDLINKLGGLAVAYFSVNRAAQLFQRTLDISRELDQLSAQTGIAVERLNGLRFVAASLNLDFSNLSSIVIEYGRRVQEAIDNPSSEAARAIQLLDIQVQNADGSIRDFDEILFDIANRFSRWPDSIEKTRVAIALFGEQGRRLIPILNQGGRAIEEQIKRYSLFHNTINAEPVKAYDRAVQELSFSLSSLLADAIEDVLPLLTDLYFGMARLLNQLRQADNSAEARQRRIRETVESLRMRTNILGEQTKMVIQEFRVLGDALERHTGENLKRTEKRLFELTDQIMQLHRQADLLFQKSMMLEFPERVPLPTRLPEQGKKASDGIGKGRRDNGESERLKQMADELQQFMQSQAQFAQEIALQRTGLIEHMILTEEQHARAVEQAQARIREAYGDTLQAQMMITEMHRELERQRQEAILDTAQMAARTLTQLFPKSKAAAVAEGIMNTAVGVTRALRDVPWPLNWIQAGLVAAAGAAQIASIRSANLSGSGSLPRTPTTGGSTSSSQPAAPPSGALIIQMPRGGFWSNDAVAELIERINSEVKNGRTLISTQTVPF